MSNSVQRFIIGTFFFAALSLLFGCSFRDFGNDSDIAGTSANANVNATEVTAPTTDPALIAAQLTQILDALASTKSAKLSQAPLAGGKISPQSLPGGLPDFTNSLIALTPTLSPALTSLSAASSLQNIPDPQAFMTQYGLNTATLALAIKNARGIVVNLDQFTTTSASGNPLITAALTQAIPLVFENPGAFKDFQNGQTNNALAAAEIMAAAIGLGVESQLAVAVPDTDSKTLRIITLGADGLTRATNETLAWRDGTPADAQIATPSIPAPETSETYQALSVTPAMAGSAESLRADTFNGTEWVDDNKDPYYSLVSTGRPAEGELSASNFRAWRLEPWESPTWKPNSSSAKKFRNNISYEIQIYRSDSQAETTMRVFTLGGFEIVGDDMEHDSSQKRGYFQYHMEVRMEPVDNNGNLVTVSGLRPSPSPRQVLSSISNPKANGYKSWSALTNGGLFPREETHSAIPGFDINSENENRLRWVIKLAHARFPPNDNKAHSSSTQWTYAGGEYRRIDTWKDFRWVKSMAFDSILMPPPHAWDDLRPALHGIFHLPDPKQIVRFKFTNKQGVRLVYNNGTGGFEHDDAFCTKFRHLTINLNNAYQ